ncbi:MAG: methyltransferase [Proteobacteria bacterium]|nr:MAG: methyltransferase [Pseudomonadota bacterium]
MLETEFEIVALKSGIKSLRLIENNETFHPGIGPIAEANILHVNQHRFAERVTAGETFILWDVGLGAAANVVAAVEAFKGIAGQFEIHSFDRSLGALQFALANLDDLDYLAPYQEAAEHLLRDGVYQLTPEIRWVLHIGDFREVMLKPEIPSPHSIFYDPYSPRGNVDMWNLDHFRAFRERLGTERRYLLTNYTRATYVRVTWLLAGFYVGVGTSIGEKEETSLASNHLDELKAPLGPKFLVRTKISHSSAPLRGPGYSTGPIDAIDYQAVLSHPQFQTESAPIQ